MVTRSNVRLGLTGAVLLMIFGAFSACTESPLAPETEFEAQALLKVQEDPEECIFVNGTLHCAPSRTTD